MNSELLRLRGLAVAEVLGAFVAMRVAFRAFRQLTTLGRLEAAHGLNFSPGLIMIAISVALIVIARRRAAEYGLTTTRLCRSVDVGVLCTLLLGVVGLVLMLAQVPMRPAQLGPGSAIVHGLGGLAVACGVLWIVGRRWWMRRPLVGVAGCVVVAMVLVAPPLRAAFSDTVSTVPVLLAVAWRVVGAGIGEEIFFRGYVQSRLNEAFGRPLQLLGTRFGVGLIVSSLLFGLVHALNPFDYFGGHFELAWWHGLATVFAPYGFIRERTGSVVAPAGTHALVDVLALLVVAGSLR